MHGWTWIVVPVVALLLTPLLRPVIAFAFGNWIAARALARQPDTITLVADTTGAWMKNPEWAADVDVLERLGFACGGTYTVAEMPGAVLRLHAHEGEALYASLHEHPLGGRWITFTTYYADGTRAQFTNCKPTGMPRRQDDMVVFAPGSSAQELHARVRDERPAGARLPVSAASAAEAYARAFADDMAWYKGRGLSRTDVARIALRRVA